MTTATLPKEAKADRVPFRLSQLEKRWTCSRMHVWREKQEARFPRIFKIGSLPYVWLDELQAYEELRAGGGDTPDA